MALRENTTRVQFAGGIETKMGEQSIPTTRLIALEDAVFTRAASLAKRSGYESLGKSVLGSPTPYSLERGLAARGPELVLFTEDSSLSYVEGAGAWSEIGDGVMFVARRPHQQRYDFAERGGGLFGQHGPFARFLGGQFGCGCGRSAGSGG